ncbi:hypothetical protein [Chitinophaga silvisoli]|nr:hypothetical protein [Chitinophaga silvisoli]
MKNIIFFRLVLPVSILIFLLSFMDLRMDLAKFRVATKGIPIHTKISAWYFGSGMEGMNIYATFSGAGVQRTRKVSEEFYKVHQINDEVWMKYLPHESVILYADEQRKSPYVVRSVLILLAIGMLIVAWKVDIRNKKRWSEEARLRRLRRRHHKRHRRRGMSGNMDNL